MWYICTAFVAAAIGFSFGAMFGNYLSEEAVKPIIRAKKRGGEILVLVDEGDDARIWRRVEMPPTAAAPSGAEIA